ncbi:MAG TPA: hypothetical protein VEH76_09105 [Methylocystis sp.]|nr:hypothetical protein [Methylocystis sp.]
MMKKLATAGLAALTVYGAVIAASSPAAAGPHWGGHWGHHGWHRGWGGVGLGVGLLGLTAGAIAADSYYGGCYIARQPVTDGWGNFLGYRNVRVCG